MENKKFSELKDQELKEVNGGAAKCERAELLNHGIADVFVVTDTQSSEVNKAVGYRERVNGGATTPKNVQKRVAPAFRNVEIQRGKRLKEAIYDPFPLVSNMEEK